MVYLINKCTHGFGNIKRAMQKLFRIIGAVESLLKNWTSMNDSSYELKNWKHEMNTLKMRTPSQKSWQRSGNERNTNPRQACRFVSSDNSIVSWILSHSNNNKLVMDTLKKAHAHNPGVSPMLQSDRGFKDTSHEYARLQLKYGFTKSVSRVIPLSA